MTVELLLLEHLAVHPDGLGQHGNTAFSERSERGARRGCLGCARAIARGERPTMFSEAWCASCPHDPRRIEVVNRRGSASRIEGAFDATLLRELLWRST
jgi:hypothetical protein